jgi:hypothetical protein
MLEQKQEWIPLIFWIREHRRPVEIKLGDSLAAELELLSEHYAMDMDEMVQQAIRHFLLDDAVSNTVNACHGSGRLKLMSDWRAKARKVLVDRAGGGVKERAPGVGIPQEPLTGQPLKPNTVLGLEGSPPKPVRRLSLTLELLEEGLRVIQAS